MNDMPVSGTGRYYNIKEYEEKLRMANQYDIKFYPQDLNFVVAALGKMPFEQAAPLINNIQQQAKDQNDLQSTAAMEGAFEEVAKEEDTTEEK